MAQRTSSTRPAGAGTHGLDDGWTAVQARWAQGDDMSGQSIARFVEIGERFVRRLHGSGVMAWHEVDHGACEGFISATTRSGTPPRPATQHTRRSAIRAIFRDLRVLGLVQGDPTVDLQLAARDLGPYRPLTGDEIAVGRAASRLGGGSRTLIRAIAWALAEAGLATSEMGAVQIQDLDDRALPTRIALPETRRLAARTAELTAWGTQVMARHVTTLGDSDPARTLAYVSRGPGGDYRAQASMCTSLARVLELAGLRVDPRVRPRSVRGWAGRSRPWA